MAAAKYQNVDQKVLSIFDIIGSYFTDTFFNHIYTGAKTGISGKKSLTDQYAENVHAYVVGVKTDKRCYEEVVLGAWKFFREVTSFSALSFADFVDRIVGACVPPAYFDQFRPGDKDDLLNNILTDLVSNLAVFATSPALLQRVIDQHTLKPDVTVRMLQDRAVDVLVTKRAEIQNKFLKTVSQARDQVPMDVVESMKAALRKLAKEKADALRRAEGAEDALRRAEDALAAAKKDAKRREVGFLKVIELLKKGAATGIAAAGASLRTPRLEQIAEADPGPDGGGELGRHRKRVHDSKTALPNDFFKPATVAIRTDVAEAPEEKKWSPAPMTSLLDSIVRVDDDEV